MGRPRTAAVGLSVHPDPRVAVGEVAGHLLERLDRPPDLVCGVVAGHAPATMAQVGAALRDLLAGPVTVLVSGSGAIVGRREVDSGPCLAAWAAVTGAVQVLRLDNVPTTAGRPSATAGRRLSGLDPVVLAEAHSLLLLADAGTTPIEALARHLSDRFGHLAVAGGLLRSPGAGARPVPISVDGGEPAVAAVALALAGGGRLDVEVVSGCRPVGPAMAVTSVERSAIEGLAGRPAAHRLAEVLADLDPLTRQLADGGLHLAVGDEDPPGAGGTVVRQLVGIDRGRGVLHTRGEIALGTTVRFQVADPSHAAAELARADRDRPSGALAFVDLLRGRRLHARDHVDASALADRLDDAPTLGAWSAGELASSPRGVALHHLAAVAARLVDR